jgi:hypothetical protein
LKEQGLVNESYVRRLLEAHRNGSANHAKPLWAVIMLQYWIDQWAS